MKRTPRMQQIEELMRSSQIVAGGFLGDDHRPIEEIIEADAVELERLGYDRQTVADRMAGLTHQAKTGLGSFVPVGEKLEVAADDNRGVLICPFGDNTRHFKTVTEARVRGTEQSVQWSDLSIHFIREHGFFQGRGSGFRLEPAELIDIIFP